MILTSLKLKIEILPYYNFISMICVGLLHKKWRSMRLKDTDERFFRYAMKFCLSERVCESYLRDISSSIPISKLQTQINSTYLQDHHVIFLLRTIVEDSVKKTLGKVLLL